jgi:polysaccharide biosynthesis protein PslG
LVLVTGLVIASCSSGAAVATPTPTKTPRPAGSLATATPPPPTENARAETPTNAPTATNPPTAAQTPAATATLKPTAAPTAGAAAATNTPQPRQTTPVAGSNTKMSSPDYGIQSFLWWRPEVADRDLNLVKDAGFGWVKQYFAWQDIEGAKKGSFDWERADRIVDEANKRGLKLLVRIGMDPDRAFWAGDPPDNTGHFADFAAQVANRYKGRIQAYQIWNEPNLAREWGKKRPDPAAYARMLRTTYNSIKSKDPNAIVVTAGMAPTTEDSDRAMPDLKFYQGIYDAMGGKSDGYFDMLGVHGAGYASPPEIDPQVVATTPKLHNNDPSPAALKRVYAFRHIEDVRDLMVKNGDANKQVVILEFGWTTDDRPNSDYYWHGAGAGIDQAKQGCYLVRALKYAKENWQPWIGLMSMIYMPDVNWTKNDEQYYWSIVGPGYPDLFIRTGYAMVKNYLTKGVMEDYCSTYQ